MTAVDTWGEAINVADTLLFRTGGQVGMLAPSGLATDLNQAVMRTEVLCEPHPSATVRLCLRFRHVRTHGVELASADGYAPADRVMIAGVEHLSWDEPVEREVDATLAMAHLMTSIGGVPFSIPGLADIEEFEGGRIVRRCAPISGLITVSAVALASGYGGVRLRVCVSNTTGRPGWTGPEATCETSLPISLIGTYLLLHLSDGQFYSPTDAPEWAHATTSELVNEGLWPVLVGDPDRRDTVLSAPIMLNDFPSIAPFGSRQT